MFRTLLYKEILNQLQTFRFAAALVTIFTLVVISTWVLGGDFVERRNNHSMLSEKYANEAANIKVPSVTDVVILRKPNELSVFAQGEFYNLGDAVSISRWAVPDEATDSNTNNSLLVSIQSFDLLAIITVVFSLFAILISHDSISLEKERGTLKLIASFPVPRSTYIWSKFVANVLVISIPVVFSIISGILILTVVFNSNFAASQWLSISLMTFSSIIYASIFIAIGMLSSIIAPSSSSSLIISLLFWTFSTLFIPSTASVASSILAPLPNSDEISNFETATRNELRRQDIAKMAEIRRKHPDADYFGFWNGLGESPWLFDVDPATFNSVIQFVAELHPRWHARAEQIWNLKLSQESESREQKDLFDTFNSVSPTYYLNSVFTSLAGTDYESFEKFMESCRNYRTAMLAEYNNRGYFGRNAHKFFTRKTREQINSVEDYQNRIMEYEEWQRRGINSMDIIDYHNQPNLDESILPSFNVISAEADYGNVATSIAMLLFMNIVIYLLCHVLYIKYDVR
jgi:ABC-type transport system involved in multi-copper enzyme maturation permease subunit